MSLRKITVFSDEVNNHIRIEFTLNQKLIYEGLSEPARTEQIIDLLKGSGFSVTEEGYSYE